MMMRSFMAIAGAAALMVAAGPAFAQIQAPREVMSPRPGAAALANTGPMTPAARLGIATIVRHYLQPCADRQLAPAPEAGEILTLVQLDLNRDGSLAGFRILDHKGVTDANRRYVPRVDQAVEAIFTGCTPIRGLPAELYDVPRGWRSMKFQYRLKA